MELIKVEMFEYMKASAPDSLESGGLGPCIAIGAIYRGKGYMLHEPAIAHYRGRLENLLSDLSNDVKDKSKLKIYLAGGELDSDGNSNHLVLTSRKIALDMIAGRGYKKCISKIDWCPTDYIQSMVLDLSNGECVIQSDSLDEYFSNSLSTDSDPYL